MFRLILAIVAGFFLSQPALAQEVPKYTLKIHLEQPLLEVLDEQGAVIKTYVIALPAVTPSGLPKVGYVSVVSRSQAWYPTANIHAAALRRGVTLKNVYAPRDPGNAIAGVWIGLGLDDPNVGLHGTIRPDQIGQRVSAGCFRMHTHEWYELAPHIESALAEGRTVKVIIGWFGQGDRGT